MKRWEYIIGSFIAVGTFSVYVATLCPTVNFIDSGELSAVAYTLGIAHPTGYPLFTLFGWIFAHLPLGLRPIVQLNLMAAFFCSFGLFFYFRFLVFFMGEFSIKNQNISTRRESGAYSGSYYTLFIPASAGTLALGFSETYWLQALSVEVYSLHLFFLSVILFLFTKALNIRSNTKIFSDKVNDYYFYGFAFVLGLSFTNHLTTILLLPGFLYLFFYAAGFSKKSLHTILRFVAPFLLGFSVSLYLPVRAAEETPKIRVKKDLYRCRRR